MQRLDFTLPEFARRAWVGDRAREVWEPRLERITKAWWQIEWRSVAAGLRPCAVIVANPQEFVEQSGHWLRAGLHALPVEWHSAQPVILRIAVGKPPDVAAFHQAFESGDHRAMARLLGHPACCAESCLNVWQEQSLEDTTWPAATATAAMSHGAATVELAGPPQANILWRWMGIRAVPHLPCRFDCSPTVDLGKRFIQLGRDAGFDDEMNWLLQILSWPVEWSALHGIAEIKTPVLKVSTRTDATATRYIVRRRGAAYPKEGAQGLKFPFRPPPQPLLTLTPGFERGLGNPIARPPEEEVARP